MSDLEREMSMLQGMDLSGTVAPVQPTQPQVAQVQATQTIVQPTNEQLQAQAQVVIPTQTMAVPVQPQVLNLDVAQNSIDNNGYITVEMGQKVSSAVVDKLKGQKDEKKRVAIFMPWFDIPTQKNRSMVVKRHFNQELGSFVCWGGECCQYEDKAVIRYLFPVIEYPIANNDVTRPLPENYGECKLKLLVAGNELYSTLSDIYQQHGNSFDGFDLVMTCTEQQYQSFTVMAANDTVRNNYKSFNACLEKWKQVRDKAYTVVARNIEPDYYRTQKGIGFNGPTVPNNVPSMESIIQ